MTYIGTTTIVVAKDKRIGGALVSRSRFPSAQAVAILRGSFFRTGILAFPATDAPFGRGIDVADHREYLCEPEEGYSAGRIGTSDDRSMAGGT